MEAIVLDIPACKALIEESVKRLYPDFIVVNDPDDTDDTALTVYPPKSYHTDLGVDVFISGAGIEFHMDVDSVAHLSLLSDSDDVARVIAQLIEDEEKASQL